MSPILLQLPTAFPNLKNGRQGFLYKILRFLKKRRKKERNKTEKKKRPVLQPQAENTLSLFPSAIIRFQDNQKRRKRLGTQRGHQTQETKRPEAFRTPNPKTVKLPTLRVLEWRRARSSRPLRLRKDGRSWTGAGYSAWVVFWRDLSSLGFDPTVHIRRFHYPIHTSDVCAAGPKCE